MYVISLTTIPPRLPRLGPVLDSLLAQRPAPEGVYLCLPERWRRFAGENPLIDLPDGVTRLGSPEDFGPATKVIPAARHVRGRVQRLIYCDDDWIYPAGWAAQLLQCGEEHEAVAASGFHVSRLKRRSEGCTLGVSRVDIAQGFGGVSVKPEWLCAADVVPPLEARNADDIWLSGQMARQGIAIRHCPEARQGLRPAFDDAHGLQDVEAEGQTRKAANRAALDALTKRYGLWPALAV